MKIVYVIIMIVILTFTENVRAGESIGDQIRSQVSESQLDECTDKLDTIYSALIITKGHEYFKFLREKWIRECPSLAELYPLRASWN